jgi:heme/copper-type cytochrome/quinol oxidase subunit 4
MRDAFGSYMSGFNLMIALCVIASVCIIVMNQINKRAAHPVIESA